MKDVKKACAGRAKVTRACDLPDMCGPSPIGDGASLSERANALGVRLAACDELLDAVLNKVGVLATKDSGMPPSDDSLSRAVDCAVHRTENIFDKLHDLARAVGA